MLDGVLNIYKEKGYTSHDVVAKMRGILKQKKIGHTGTLDPDAEGVLPVCLGQATRLCDMLTDHDKTYRAVMLLGVETDTQDSSGQVLSQKNVDCSEETVRQAIDGFVGAYDQVPPMYSALKVDGKRLYELARQGKVVERKARPVTIYEITVESVELPRVTMTVHCSKGTYIRTLCHDIGQKLGCGACMESLLRTQVERFRLEDSITLGELEKIRDAGETTKYLISVEQMFSGYPAAASKKEADSLVHNGNPVKLSQVELGQGNMEIKLQPGDRFRLYDSEGLFLGIYEYQQEKNWMKPQKMFLGGKQG